jgi:hypothetical protein
MSKVAELIRQGRNEELWQMCCGYLKLDINQFMAIQKRLLNGQIDTLSHSKLGRKLFSGTRPETIEEFRQIVPLTTYANYSPELVERRDEDLPEKPSLWVHTSGRSGEFPCKWLPLTSSFIQELGPIMCGIGLLSASSKWGDTAPLTQKPNFVYTVAPRPYMSGALASILIDQIPSRCFPSLDAAEKMPFDERIKLGFGNALVNGLDYFFGLSLVLAAVGEKFNQSEHGIIVDQWLNDPRAMVRTIRGLMKARLAGRKMLPKDLWKVKGIVTGGLDSSVYREKIKEYWGRYPLDIYASTEAGVIATQTWDYDSMTFIPNLNFLEFIPEKEHMKWQLDHNYQPKTVLLDEVESGEIYELVITSLHGGALVRYRIGDMVRITSFRNEYLSINIPQMVFERRADDLLDFATIRLSEKSIWQAIERSGIRYNDWVAYKNPGEMVLNIMIEPKENFGLDRDHMEMALYEQILQTDNDVYSTLEEQNDLSNMIKFRLKLTLLPSGAFNKYTAHRIAEGADIAHLKPHHINPSPQILSQLRGNLLPENDISFESSSRTNRILVG